MFRTRILGSLCCGLLSLALLAACGGGEGVESDGGAGVGSGGEKGAQTCSDHPECPEELPSCIDGNCSPCVDDATCSGRERTRCDLDSGTCVACRVDGDCAGGRCNPDHRCVECLGDADCESGDCVAGICQRNAGCTSNADCGQEELCVLPDGQAQFGRCEETCDPYGDGAAQCPGAERCALVSFTQELDPVGACLAPNDGAGVEEACQPEACERDLICISYGEENERCTALCDPEAANGCDAGFRCDEIELDSPAGASIGICIPDLRNCEVDADCDEDQVCTIAQAEEGGLERVCAEAVGSKRGGEPCTTGADCASNFCLAGQQVCYGTCEVATDCAAGSTCVDVNFTLPDQTTEQAPACFPTCGDDEGCNPNQTCSLAVSRAGDAFVTVCNPAGGSLGPGSLCESGAACRSNNCANGACFGICDDDTDCGGETECAAYAYQLSPGPDGWSGTADDVWQTVGTCQGTVCASDAECGAGWACSLMRDPGDTTRTQVVQRCVGETGASPGGAPCSSGSECRSGLCFDPRQLPEDCNDGADNDGDGLVDCDDPDCHEACSREHDCFDGVDDDGDGAVDCADGDCAWDCSYEIRCDDGIDNDGNGLIDCDDPDCDHSCGNVETDCSDGVDNDGDGFIDCEDDDCQWYSVCRESSVGGQCGDGIDNDGDGFTDCADDECATSAPCAGIDHEGAGDPALCTDGEDNDGDGFVDCDDPGCAVVAACQEIACAGGNCCANGLDDDGDGRADCLDPDCAQDPSCNEAGRCDDGADNDGDGLVDCHDPDCATDPACDESRCPNGNCCSDGVDNDGDGGIDCVDDDCFSAPACNESACGNGHCCADGVDNDGDGKTDCDDWDCRYSTSCYEHFCTDGTDNDGDGLADCDDPDCFNNSACRGGICFEACGADADCDSGMRCTPEAAWVVLASGTDDYGYAAACTPSAP